MKRNGTCRDCGSKEHYEIEDARQGRFDNVTLADSLTVVAHYAPTGESGFFGDKKKLVEVRLSATVCAGCGHTEWFARDLDRLAMLARIPGAGVRKVSPGDG